MVDETMMTECLEISNRTFSHLYHDYSLDMHFGSHANHTGDSLLLLELAEAYSFCRCSASSWSIMVIRFLSSFPKSPRRQSQSIRELKDDLGGLNMDGIKNGNVYGKMDFGKSKVVKITSSCPHLS